MGGKPVDRTLINKLFKTYSEKIGKEITPHDLRHFFCSHALNSGMSVHEVANQAGHSNIHTTLLYTNPSKSELLKKMNQL
ncbi:site-specific integrase [Niallia oryzisoli]|uniref:Site-specific integrase n=1 Tax=Niallia oryzisoli TaxID=1737571 RepID=A0ABZ2CL48_9BACI